MAEKHSDIGFVADDTHDDLGFVPEPAPGKSPRTTGSIPGDVMAGIGASVLQLPVGAYKLAHRLAPSLVPPPSEYWEGTTKAPETFSGKLGEFAGTAGQFLAPGAAVSRGVKALETGVNVGNQVVRATKLGSALARGAGEAASAGAIEGLRTGGDIGATKRAAALGGLAAGASEALTPVVKKIATAFLGKSTGAGAEAIRTAADATAPRFKEAMRNKITETEIVQDARDALEKVAQNRADTYRQAFGQLDQNIRLDASKAMRTILNELPNFKVGFDPRTLKLSFQNSRLSTSAAAADRELMQEGVDMVRNWTDFSPAGMDSLKQAVYDLSKNADARVEPFFLRVANTIKEDLNQNVPGYKALTKDYDEASEALNTFRRELSINAPNPGTTIRKLSYALNQHNNFRSLVLDMLDQAAGSHLKETMAGYSLRDPLARGLAGVGQGLSMGLGGLPTLARSLAFGSPRAVGETLAFLSALKRSSLPLPPSLTPLAPAVGAQLSPPPQ